MDVFWFTLLLLLRFHTTDGVRCFSRFAPSSLTCEGFIGEVDQENCCFNPNYGYQTEDGVCQSCGNPTWTSWSEWSQSTTLCGEGVRLRRRSCYGKSKSECVKGERLQAEAWNGTCCDGEGWKPWSDWSACLPSCGEGGVKHRSRKCTNRPECALACVGAAEETQDCPVVPCPVHGGWSEWSDWSECSGTCVAPDNVPNRVRRRSCSSPPPSANPPGDGCPGDSVHTQPCTELRNCPVNGGWGPWKAPEPCSVSCGEGLALIKRSCDNPRPQYGGLQCEGPSTNTSVCYNPCPVESYWTGWSMWSECSRTCLPDKGPLPQRTRQRVCITFPGGVACEGLTDESGSCPGLDYCKVHGSWGPWSAFSTCQVTCGVGLQRSTRSCNSPAPKHGGQSCHGDASRSQMCNTQQGCPVDGVWSEWTPWGPCEEPFEDYKLNCKAIPGSQSRRRKCDHRALGGAACPPLKLSESRGCYDVEGCDVYGQWGGWEAWSQCRPPCGAKSQRTRKMLCIPNYKQNYSLTIGNSEEPATFFGDPILKCGGRAKKETEKCINAPAC